MEINRNLKIIETFFQKLKEVKTMDTIHADGVTPTPTVIPAPVQQISSALKEAGYQYVALLLILISNLWTSGDWQTIGSLALAYAVFLFAGWVKKIAELKINELIAQSGIKDKEILILKEVKVKLESEIKNLVDKLNNQ